jgi:hypothetical protein
VSRKLGPWGVPIDPKTYATLEPVLQALSADAHWDLKVTHAVDGRVLVQLAPPPEPARDAVLRGLFRLLRSCKAPKVTVEDEVFTGTVQVPPEEESSGPPDGPRGKK